MYYKIFISEVEKDYETKTNVLESFLEDNNIEVEMDAIQQRESDVLTYNVFIYCISKKNLLKDEETELLELCSKNDITCKVSVYDFWKS